MAEKKSSSSVQKSIFSIPKMDCPSEENFIRMALADLDGVRLSFDLAQRELTVLHHQPPCAILDRLTPLNLGAVLRESVSLSSADGIQQQSLFDVPKMDCLSEENIIRMALQGVPDVTSLSFELAKRQVTVLHQGGA